jgi:glyoxylase-like metal-dependent hydrolase (beta-lactamase superfamily II)
MQQVAESIVDTTDGKLDVLVVTHEHWDHLSGFLQAQAIFEKLEIGEVWVAWTEDPDDELATELRARKRKRLRGLVRRRSSPRRGTRPRPGGRKASSTRCSASTASAA